jgi:rhamnose transport system permease protein
MNNPTINSPASSPGTAPSVLRPEESRRWAWLRSREMLLLVIFFGVLVINLNLSPYFLGVDNLVNVFQLSIEKAMMALTMTFVIISAEIDLSVASMMALCATVFGILFQNGAPVLVAMLGALITGAACGAFNGLMIAYLGLPSLAVTLAGLVGYRGLAFVLLEDKSASGFPDSFIAFGHSNIPGLPFPPTLVLFALLLALCVAVLHFSAFGRRLFVIGNNKEAARFAGVDVKRIKWSIYVAAGLMSALAGLVYATRIGSVRADLSDGAELDVITMVVLGGVSIFGGSGSLLGVFLSILIVLSLRNGMSLGNINGSVQTSVIGSLLVLSLLLPNVFHDARVAWRRLRRAPDRPIRKDGLLPATSEAKP